ncbi:hypothetical protein FACS1894123_08300 [Bacteroidia bacterium]|nr:hypothetical protein FACS1894123_08300 [Bacteroidia bacterium]
MGKFDLYRIDLKGMQTDILEYEYLLDNQFFTNIGGEDVQKGKVNVRLKVTKVRDVFNFDFDLKGTVVVTCDRCLDDMDFPFETTSRLIVKLGKDYSEESDEIVVIPESEGVINFAWFLYEFIVLAIPIKHVHPVGKCNKQMTAKLKKHSVKSGDSEDEFDAEGTPDVFISDDDEFEEETPDPRWNALKKVRTDEE